MIPNKSGLYNLVTVQKSGLPIFDLTQEEPTGIPLVFWTNTDLKAIKCKLERKQRECMIRGFIKTSKRMKGYAALYDLKEVLLLLYSVNLEYKQSGNM